MDIAAWLAQGGVDQPLENLLQPATLGRLQFNAEVTADVPVREQAQLATQQGLVVLRQQAGRTGALPEDEGIDGRHKQGIGVVGGQHVEVGAGAEVAEKKQTLREILCQYARYMNAGSQQQTTHLHERTAVLILGWGIHDDPAAPLVAQPEIAAEAGVSRGRAEVGVSLGQRQPER